MNISTAESARLAQKAAHLNETLRMIDVNLSSPELIEEDRPLIEKSRHLFSQEYAQVRSDIELLMAHRALTIAKQVA